MHSLHANKLQAADNFPFVAHPSSSITNNHHLGHESLHLAIQNNVLKDELSYEVEDDLLNNSKLTSSVKAPEIKPFSTINSRKGKQLFTGWPG